MFLCSMMGEVSLEEASQKRSRRAYHHHHSLFLANEVFWMSKVVLGFELRAGADLVTTQARVEWPFSQYDRHGPRRIARLEAMEIGPSPLGKFVTSSMKLIL